MKRIAAVLGMLVLFATIIPVLAISTGAEVGTFECGIGIGTYWSPEHDYPVPASYTQYIINGNRWKMTYL